MTHARERISVSDRYLRSLGRATYNFVYLEWGIVWLMETLDRGFLYQVPTLTAGQIAKQFLLKVGSLTDCETDKTDLVELASAFKNLTEDRNRLMHGNPFTADGGEQRLLYDGKHGRKEWTIELMDQFADEIALASIEASRLLHGGCYQAWKDFTPSVEN